MEQLLPKNLIYLDEEVKLDYPAVVALDENGYSLNFESRKNINPFCYHCGDRVQLYYLCASFKHFYCNTCFNYSIQRLSKTCIIENEPFLHQNPFAMEQAASKVFQRIKFKCQWEKCGKFFGDSNIRQHELSCDKQPERECPVRDCQWKGNLNELEKKHFQEHEDGTLILKNVVNAPKSNKTYYLLILGKFVKVQYLAEELGEVYEHSVDFEVCKDAINGVKPMGTVSAGKNILLKNINGSGSVKSIRKNVALFVYFEDA